MANKTEAGRFGLFVLGGALTGGAWWGYLIGGIVGTYLFPPKFEKPDKYTELGLNTSAAGIAQALVYGTVKLGCNYLFADKLEAREYRSRSSGGGKAGKKPVAGHKYYIKAALGICRGIAKITRMWAGKDVIYHLGHPTLTFYRGTADQTTDPTLATLITNAVPYRGLAYAVLNRYYLGKDHPQAPQFNFEIHRYPFDDFAGASSMKGPHVYAPYETDKTLTDKGLFAKGRDDKIYLLKRGTTYWDEIVAYDNDFVEQWRKDILAAGIPNTTRYVDIDIIDTYHGQFMYVVNSANGHRLQAHRFKLSADVVTATGYRRGNWAHWELTTIATTEGKIDHNATNIFIAYEGGGAFVKKFSLDSLSTELAEYDLSVGAGISSFDDMAANDDFFFVLNESNSLTYIWNTSGTYKTSGYGGDAYSIEAPYGSQSYLLLRWNDEPIDLDGDRLYCVTYDLDAVGDPTNLVLRDTNQIWEWWIDQESPFTQSTKPEYQKIFAGPDGTLLLSGYHAGAVQAGVMHVVLDANPAQVAYDIIINELGRPESSLDLDHMKTFSDYCWTKGIGVSAALVTQEDAAGFMQNLMTYVQGQIYRGNDGKLVIRVFQDTDPVEDPITDADLFALSTGQGGGYEGGDYEKVGVLLKDPRKRANRINVKYRDRFANYREANFQADHFLAQTQAGEVITDTIDYIWFSNIKTAGQQAYRLLKFATYDIKIYTVPLIAKYLYLEIGSILPLDIASQHIDQTVRVVSIDEPKLAPGMKGVQITGRIEESYLNQMTPFGVSQSNAIDTGTAPPTQVLPLVFEQPALQNNDKSIACITALAFDDSTIACDVYVSEDDVDYQLLDTLNALPVGAQVAAAVAADDTRIVVDPAAFDNAIPSYTVEEQRNNRSFALMGEVQADRLDLDGLEFLSFREVEDVGGGQYALRNCYRGKDYTLAKAHTTDAIVVVVGTTGAGSFIPYEFTDPKIGKTIYVKCVPINLNGEELDFDDMAAYEYTILGLTRKATHVSGLQLEVGGQPQGSLETVTLGSDTKVIWNDTNRVGGIDRVSITAWPWNDFLEGAVNDYDALIYNAGGTLIATYASIGDVFTWTYTNANRVSDGAGTDFFIGIRPREPRGSVGDYDDWIAKQHVLQV